MIYVVLAIPSTAFTSRMHIHKAYTCDDVDDAKRAKYPYAYAYVLCMCDVTHRVQRDSLTRVTCLSHTCDVTDSFE